MVKHVASDWKYEGFEDNITHWILPNAMSEGEKDEVSADSLFF